jgi:hypothetical protein
MNHSLDFAESLREDADRRAASRRSARAAELLETCQSIRDLLTQKEYDAWFASVPAEGFFAASVEMLHLLRLAAVTSYNGRHVPGVVCPKCSAPLIVNEKKDKTTDPARPFFTRRLVCSAWSSRGCSHRESFSCAALTILYAPVTEVSCVEF